jgi:hypothetical protein
VVRGPPSPPILVAVDAADGMQGRLKQLRGRFVDEPGSLGDRARTRRWAWFRDTFPAVDEMRVLDLGGTADFWLRAKVRPGSVHCVNLSEGLAPDLPDWLAVDLGDAVDLDPGLLQGPYDLVYSNSVIEHVGGPADQRRFADNVRNLADRHWIQTPYRYFPIEPHWVFPGFQFLPLKAKANLSRWWPLMHTNSADEESAIDAALGVQLLSKTEMQHYFPDSEIWDERSAGLVKSLIAVRTG